MKVTAFILSHKLEQYLDRAVGSVVTQTRLPDEIVLVGTDCRTETYDAMRHWEQHRLKPRLLFSDKPLTCMQSKNFCSRFNGSGDISHPNTEAFFILDADDWLMPHFIERCFGYMEGSNAAAVGCDYQVIERGIVTPAVTNTIRLDQIGTRNPLPAVSIVRRSAFESVGGYREDFTFEDWACWIDLTRAGYRLFRYPQILFNHNRHATNLTNTTNNAKGYEQIQCLLSLTTAKPSALKS
jgi:cellulose synthase/poly-beta-1,6-N-acetylglucosamine synthase-like glycosyltransferase